MPSIEEYKKGGKVKSKKGSVTQTVNVYVTKRGGGGKRNPPKPPTLTANGMPVSYQQSLPVQLAEISKIQRDMKLGFQQQQIQLQQLQSHINQPLPATLPEDRRLYPTIAFPPPSSVQISTNINPEHDRDNAQQRRYAQDLYPYASSGLSSGLVETANQTPMFAFSAHQTPVQSRRGSLSNFILGEMNRPDALTVSEALHGNRTSTSIPDNRPFLPTVAPRPLPFGVSAFANEMGTMTDIPKVGRPSTESRLNERVIWGDPLRHQQLAEQKEPDKFILRAEDLESPMQKMKKGGKVKK
jgi:hypothetical protein